MLETPEKKSAPDDALSFLDAKRKRDVKAIYKYDAFLSPVKEARMSTDLSSTRKSTPK